MERNMSITIIGGIFMDVKAWPQQAMRWGDSNAGNIRFSAGGVARNIAENIGRLGLPIQLFGAVGADLMGQQLLHDTALAGVDTAHIMRSDAHATGCSMIQLDQKGELLCCTTDMGATALIDEIFIEKKWKDMQASRLIIADTELEARVLQLLVRKVNQAGIPLLIEPVSGEKSARVASLQGEVAFFTPNEVEFDAFEKAQQAQPNPTRIQHLLKTCGAQGVWWQPHGLPGRQLPVREVSITDATGAGDAFAAGFASAIFLQKEMQAAITFGQKLAALTLQSPLAVSEAITPELLQDV